MDRFLRTQNGAIQTVFGLPRWTSSTCACFLANIDTPNHRISAHTIKYVDKTLRDADHPLHEALRNKLQYPAPSNRKTGTHKERWSSLNQDSPGLKPSSRLPPQTPPSLNAWKTRSYCANMQREPYKKSLSRATLRYSPTAQLTPWAPRVQPASFLTELPGSVSLDIPRQPRPNWSQFTQDFNISQCPSRDES